MATKRMKRRTRRRSCKNGKLKRPVRTKKGGKRRCRKSRRKRSRRKTKYSMQNNEDNGYNMLIELERYTPALESTLNSLSNSQLLYIYYRLDDQDNEIKQRVVIILHNKMRALVTYVNGQVGNDILMFNETTGRIRVLNRQLLTEYWFDSIKNKSIDDEMLEDIILFKLINPNLRNTEYWTALNLAFQRGHTSYVQILKKYTTVF